MFGVSGCVWLSLKLNWKKYHTTAGIIFWLTNTCAQISARAQDPGRADRQGDVFRSSFLSQLDSTTLRIPKGVGGGGLSGVGLVYLNS